MTRLQRLQERIEEPFLVTTPANVRYLTGFDSTNAALLVDDDRARLFSDFRYAEAGKRVPDVEFSITQRNLFGWLADELSGRVGFEADAVTYAAYQALAAGGLELVPRRGVVEALRAVKDEDELALIRRAAEITSEAFARPRRGAASSAGPRETSRGGWTRSTTSSAQTSQRSRRSSPPVRTARRRTLMRATP